MQEIITIQFGRQANFVGSHYWNAQESYHTFGSDEISPVDHDIQFRQGVGPDGSDTYLPRALLYDLRGGFGSLARVNALGADVGEVDETGAWNGALTRLQATTTDPSPYLKSLVANELPVFPTVSTTRYFSDFASTFYHSRSPIPVNPAHPVLDPVSQETTSSVPSFHTYADGSSLFQDINAQEDIFDRDLRPWIEECDALQGIQVLASTDDAWAGFATRYVEDVRDQLGKASIWVWGLDGLEQKEQTFAARRARLLSGAAALASLNADASLYVPISLPSVFDASIQLDRAVLWHTAGLASAVIDSITLPVRLRPGVEERVPRLSDWEAALDDNGRRKLAEIAMELGNPSKSSQGMPNGQSAHPASERDARTLDQIPVLEDEENEMEATNAPLPISLSPFAPPLSSAGSYRSKTFTRIEVLRGSSWNNPFDALSVEQDLRFLRRGRPVIESYRVPRPVLPLVPTFPHIFTRAPPPSQTSVPGLETRASLRTSSAIARWVRGLESTVRAMPPALLADAVGDSERENLSQQLNLVAEVYVEGWESGSDTDEDD